MKFVMTSGGKSMWANLTHLNGKPTASDINLGKIKRGTFGICEMCEEPIGFPRLEVKNFARFCITCREITEKEQK